MLKVDQALVDAFIDGAFGLSIAHENANFTPAAGTPWVELMMFPADETGITLSDANEFTGVFQAILRYPDGAGAIAAKTKASAIFAAFPIGRVITYDSQPVTITAHSRLSGRVDGGWYVLPCRLTFVAMLPR